MRYGRRWVRQQAAGKRVLNLFAYTCGFSVAAIAGGAQQVVNLDMAKAALSRDGRTTGSMIMTHPASRTWAMSCSNPGARCASTGPMT